MKRHWRKWGFGLCVLLAALLAGCQAAGGVNLDEMMLKQLETASLEQSGKLELEIDWNEKYLQIEDPEFAKYAELFGRVSLEIKNAKTDQAGRSRIEGSLALGGKAPVSFALHVDENKLSLEAEGAKRTLVIDLEEAAGATPSAFGPGIEEDPALLRQLVREAAVYFVKHLPNPPKVDVSREFTNVNGQSLQLTKVHAELNGQEIGELLVRYVDALVQDEAGFREMLGNVVKLLAEVNPEQLQEMGGSDAESPDMQAAMADEAFHSTYPMLKEIQATLEEAKQDPEWDVVFDKGITLKTDLYLDNQLHIRKSDTELSIAPIVLQMPTSPVHSVTLRMHSEMWNVNGDVTVPPVETPDNAVGTKELDEMSSIQFVRLFEEDSVLYDLLKNEFEIDDTRFELDEYSFYGTAPILVGEGGSATLHVPVREALDDFENEIEYDPETAAIRFTDEGTNREIVLTIGSSEAQVNGKPVALSEPVYLIDGYAYMAADDLFGLLNATYTYEKDESLGIVVTVERDL